MLFLWTTTKHGRIWLDGDSFRRIIDERLPEGHKCQDLSFVGEQSLLNAYISLPEKDAPEVRSALSTKFEEFFRQMGISIKLNWTEPSGYEPPHSNELWKHPWFWAAVCGAVVGLSNLGLAGTAWVLIAAAIGFGVSWLALTEAGKDILSGIAARFRRGAD